MRLPQLDYLRGIAVLLVLGRHLDPLPAELGWAVGPLAFWEQCGWVGVDLFFVLSGFLVSGILLTEFRSSGQVRVGRFLVRRGLKIYPAFYFLLFITALLPLAHHRLPPLYPFLCEVSYIQNYGTPLWQHTWTLAVEEHFYLLLALAVTVVTVNPALQRRRLLVGGCVAGMLAVLGARIITWKLGVLDPSRYCETHLRIDAFLAGVLLAYFYHYRRENLLRWMAGRRGRVALAGLVLVCPCLLRDVSHPAMLTFGYTSLSLGFALILLAILAGAGPLDAPAGGVTALTPLGFIGLYSYSIYLWHVPIRRWAPPAFRRLLHGTLPGWLEIGLYLVGSVVVGCLMAKLIERPFLHFRDRYFPSAIKPAIGAGSLTASQDTPLETSVPA